MVFAHIVAPLIYECMYSINAIPLGTCEKDWEYSKNFSTSPINIPCCAGVEWPDLAILGAVTALLH